MEYSANYYRKPRSKRKHKIIIACLIVVLIIILAFWLWARGDNQGSVAESNPKTAKVLPNKTFNGTHISFQYKGSYRTVKHTVNPPNVELALFKDDTSEDKTLSVEVAPQPKGGLAGDSGYYYRQLHPQLYSSKQVSVAGDTAVEWSKSDGTEITTYIPHQSLMTVLSFSVSSSNDIQNLPGEVSLALNSFQWK